MCDNVFQFCCRLPITSYLLPTVFTMSMVHPDRVHAAEMKLAEDPHDIESWQMLIKNAQCRNIDEARETYERLVDAFPTCGRYWKLYIEQEVSEESHVGDVGGTDYHSDFRS